MSEDISDTVQGSSGALAENVAHFARALRVAGVPIGPGMVIEAVRALTVAGVGGRDDLYWTLHACLVMRREHSAVFDQAFRLFFRRRNFLEKMMALLSPEARETARDASKPKPGALRARLALDPPRSERMDTTQETRLSARLSMSDRETLRNKDFVQMTAEEIAEAIRAIDALILPDDALRARRRTPSPRGDRIDPRRSFRRALASGGDLIDLARTERAVKTPPLALMIDISGSMDDYTRIFMHFAHALTRKRRRVHVFVFGTRLTNVTRPLRAGDPDEALAACAGAARDWAGGTRIADALRAFNRDWSRRVLGQGATLLLFTDGLERGATDDLAFQTARLRRSCRRLIWLNPLLRFDAFAARAGGIRAMLPHVDAFRPVHNLASVADLCAALAADAPLRDDPRAWLRAAA